ncbi:hypothetical protein PVAG01_01807 [Phlyctema vagabunda]|uniref:ABM domain-containing protein n=1 Tax=Phlyctema vagabunda TaxID=108571 RepID=A0ABR4PY74_9HELO
MVVTEVAILPLSPGAALSAPAIARFKEAKATLEKAHHYDFYFFQQVEDPSIIYILGSWPSVAAHQAFLPSTENQRLLTLLRDEVNADQIQMFHVDGDLLHSQESRSSFFDVPLISCSRHFVPTKKKDGFINKFGEVEPIFRDYIKPTDVKGGWRIEKEEVAGTEREEWVLLSGFDSVEHHQGLRKSDGFTQYREIEQFVSAVEVCHLKKIEGL